MNSGSEANDLALRIASAAAAQDGAVSPLHHMCSSSNSSSRSRSHVVVMAGAYHGHLSSLIPLRCVVVWGGQGGVQVSTIGGQQRPQPTASIAATSTCPLIACAIPCAAATAPGCCSPYKFWGPGGSGKPDWVHVMPAPDMYRLVCGTKVWQFELEMWVSCWGFVSIRPEGVKAPKNKHASS